MASTVITYGGGEILKNIFEGVALLMNSKSGDLFRPLMMTSATIGAVWAIVRAFFSPSLEAFLGKFFFPLIATVSLLMVPTASVHIEDVLTNHSYKVSHVPLLLAKSSELISTVGFTLTRAVEKVMHTPNDTNYLSTGMIFGSEASLEMGQYRLTNGNLEQNMRRFCKQCVLYDIALNRYTIDDLKKSTDLFEFFKAKTSNVRMISYTSPDAKDSGKTSYVTCRDAIKLMAPQIAKEKQYYSQHEVLKNLPLSFQALTGMQQDQQKIIGQQLVMNTLRNEYSAEGFASARAHMQQRSTYRVLGTLAASSLVTMRAVIEALIYASFIFIMPMALIPGGFRFISKWLWLLVWIQMWPPFFAILSYVMQTVAYSQSESIFYGLTAQERGLSLFTSVGLSNLREDIYALAGYLSASIPFISYAILQGGVGSFIHLAGAMMTPAHAAATTAAGEQATGNYSFGNASMGQTHYGNASIFQRNMAPSLSSGFMQEERGSSSVRHTTDGAIINQHASSYLSNVQGDEMLTASLNRTQGRVDSYMESESQALTSSIAMSSRSAADVGESISHSMSVQDSSSLRSDGSEMESARIFCTVSEDWGKQYGLSSRQSMEIMAGASAAMQTGTPLKSLIGTGFSASVEGRISASQGLSRDEVLSSAMRTAEGQEVQESFQSLASYASSNLVNTSNDSLRRASLNLVESVDEAKQHSSNIQKAESHSESIQEQMAYVKSQSASIRHNFNQELLRYGVENYFDGSGGVEKVNEVMSLPASQPEKQRFLESFIDSRKAELLGDNFGSFESQSWFDEQQDGFREKHAASSIPSLDKERATDQVFAKFSDEVHENLKTPDEIKDQIHQIRDNAEVGIAYSKGRLQQQSNRGVGNVNNKIPGLSSTN